MMDISLEEVKIIARSLLLSEQKGLSAKVLENRLERETGKPVLYQRFGHKTFIEFLKSMPDTVIIRQSYNNDVQCFPVATKETKHIQMMVQRQKDSSNSRIAAHKLSRNLTYGPSQKPQRYSFVANNIPYNNNFKSASLYNYPPPKTNTFSERNYSLHEVKADRAVCIGGQAQQKVHKVKVNPTTVSNICKLITAYPQGVWLSKLDGIYSKAFNLLLDYQPFSSVCEFLNYIPEVKITKRNGMNYVNLTDEGIKLANQLSEAANQKNNRDSANQYVTNRLKDEPAPVVAKEEEFKESPFISASMKKNFHEILKAHPKGIWATSFKEEYKKVKGYDLELKDHNCNNIMDLVDSCSDVFGVEHPRRLDGDLLLYDIKGKKPSEYYNDLDERELKEKINEYIWKLLSIFEKSPEGIYLREVEEIFRNIFHEAIPWVSLKFESLKALLEEMKSNNLISLEKSPRGTVIIPRTSQEEEISPLSVPVPNCDGKNKEINVPPGFAKQPSTIPEDAALTRDYDLEKLPPLNSINHWLPVYVSFSYRPDHFYIQLAGDFGAQLEKLQEEMRIFYNSSQESKYIMHAEHISQHILCVALHESFWYRAIIQDYSCGDQVNVFFIDYGQPSVVSAKDLRFIKNEYLKFPAQALKARLFGIQPLDERNQWSEAACHYFYEVIINKTLQAQVHAVSPEDQKLSVSLYYTSHEGNKNISDELVKRNFARNLYDDDLENEILDLSDDLENLPDNSRSSSLISPNHSFPEEVSDGDEQFISAILEADNAQVKRISLGHNFKPFHLIHLSSSKKFYLTYQEISSLFPEIESLRKTLVIKNAFNITCTTISEQEYPDLFLQLKSYSVPDVSFDRDSFKVLMLYPIKSVLMILGILGHPYSKSIGYRILEEVNNFDSLTENENIGDGPYHPSETDDISSLPYADLIAMCQSLMLKRCDMYHAGQQMNNDFTNVDRQITECHQRINVVKEHCKDMLTIALSLHQGEAH